MNRRHLLQAMFTVPVIGALGGCRRDYHGHHAFPSSRGGTLLVILQGPFALVLDTKNHYRIKAFVPFDDDGKHEFRFGDPHNSAALGEGEPGNRHRYQFTLPENNLEISEQPRHIDAGFYDFKLHTGEWAPSPSEYFVALDLPAPDIITFYPPATPVEMAGSRLAMMPTNHVLEYRVREFDEIHKVRMRSPQLGDNKALSCSDLLAQYQEHWHEMEKAHLTSRQRKYMEAELNGCANSQVSAFFLGVGLPYRSPSFDTDAPTHALEFFNHKLLASFPNAPDRLSKQLLKVDVKPCEPVGNSSHLPRLLPAAQRHPMPQPRLVPVSSADDCRAGGIIGILP